MTGKMTAIFLAAALALAPGCVPAPQQAYTIEQLPQIAELAELMRVLYEDLKPAWDLAERAPLAEADFDLAATVAARVEAIAVAVGQNFAAGRAEGFAAYATQLQVNAQDLGRGAGASDTPGVQQSITRIGETCDACHGSYR